MTNEEAIAKLREYRSLIEDYEMRRNGETRQKLNERKPLVKQIVLEAGQFQTFTITPPPLLGGLIHRDVDAFDVMFNEQYGLDLISPLKDMLDSTVGSISAGGWKKQPRNEPSVESQSQPNYAFIAMAIGDFDRTLVDTLDAIKETARTLGITAERVDEQQSNESITKRILESIQKAEFVIVDLTHEKPNVYYEAGYAQALGKTPIYIAKTGTSLHFDIKDFPIIFWDSYRTLKNELKNRIEGIQKGQKTSALDRANIPQ